MTKEQILDKHKIFLGADEPRYPPELLKAMDEYAKMNAVSFLDWANSAQHVFGKDPLTPNRLYTLFIVANNKQV